MLFPTVEFGLFFLAVFSVSWLLRGRYRWRKWALIVASYAFYACWDWRFTGLLLGSTAGNYALGLAIARAASPRGRKSLLTLALAANLGLLGFFKYYGFFVGGLDALLSRLGLPMQLPLLQIVLPVGISFYTFTALGYVLDVFHRHVKPCRSFPDLLLFLSFFPQLVAGPINRASVFLPQLEREPDASALPVARAVLLIVGGLAKKMLIANYLATGLVDPLFRDPASHSTAELLLGIYGYAVQIYCDFSAYTDIAIGVALLLGYRLPANFRQPYRSDCVQEFWRRWHISLSTWLQTYLFMPTTKRLMKTRLRRRGNAIAWIGYLTTFLLCGLWHGAAWTFVLWGGLHGVAIGLERTLRQRLGGRLHGVGWRVLSVAATFHFVCLTWVLFRAPGFGQACDYLRAFGNTTAPSLLVTPAMLALVAVGLAMHFVPEQWQASLESGFARLPVLVQGAAFGLALTAIGAMGPTGVAPFIYFQF